MRVLLKIGAFAVLFVLFLIWRFPYDSLVERAVRKAEDATGATILYTPSSAGPFGVKVKDLTVRLASGASLKFDSARIFPTSDGLSATAYQGDSEMEVDFLSKERNLVIELDGDQHLADKTAYRCDRKKDALLQEHGYMVLRFLTEDLGKTSTKFSIRYKEW